MVNHFFPPKPLQLQKRYHHWGLFKPQDSNIRNFIFSVNDIAEYLEHSPQFRKYQVFPEYEINDLVKFYLLRKWQRKLLVQGSDSYANILNNIIEFCKRLKTANEIFHDEGDVSHSNYNLSSPVIYTNHPHWIIKRFKSDQ